MARVAVYHHVLPLRMYVLIQSKVLENTFAPTRKQGRYRGFYFHCDLGRATGPERGTGFAVTCGTCYTGGGFDYSLPSQSDSDVLKPST